MPDETKPKYMGIDIGERLYPLIDPRTMVTENGPVEGMLFVKPEDGSVCFREVTQLQQEEEAP